MSDNEPTASRKSEHVRIVLDEDVAAKGVYTGFAAYRLPHDALPELDLAEIDIGIIKRFHATPPSGGADSAALSVEGRAIAMGAERTMSRMPSGRSNSKN